VRTVLLVLLLAGIGLAAWLLGLFEPPTAHIAALVPEDATYAVVTRSLNELREAYEGKYAPRDADPARDRFGRPVNVPGLDGFDYDRPAGYFANADGRLVYVVPVADGDAFEAAHAGARENIHAKEPVRVAKHYLSVSQGDAVATVRDDDPWILEAATHPLALVGRPADALRLKAMLVAFFQPDGVPRVRNALPVANLFLGLPDRVADPMASELERFRLALKERESPGRQVRFDLVAEPSAKSHFARAAKFAADARVADLVGLMPAGKDVQTVLAVSALLDGEGWKAFGAPFDVGPAAAAFGIASLRFRAGRHAAIFALAPTDPARLDGFFVAPADAEERAVGGTPVRVWRLAGPPPPLASVLATDAANPPPLYACTTRVDDVWFGAIGAHAEEVVRALVHAAKGETQKTMRNLVADENRRVAPTRAHDQFFHGGRIAIGFMDARAQRAVDFPLPYVPMASIAQPEAVTFVLTASEGRFYGELRCFVAGAE